MPAEENASFTTLIVPVFAARARIVKSKTSRREETIASAEPWVRVMSSIVKPPAAVETTVITKSALEAVAEAVKSTEFVPATTGRSVAAKAIPEVVTVFLSVIVMVDAPVTEDKT